MNGDGYGDGYGGNGNGDGYGGNGYGDGYGGGDGNPQSVGFYDINDFRGVLCSTLAVKQLLGDKYDPRMRA